MKSPAQRTAPPPEADRAVQDSLYYRDILHEVIDMAADIARKVHGEAVARPDVAAGVDGKASGPTIAFERVARTIRRCITLARKVMEPAPAQEAAPERGAAARQQIIRAVEDAIHHRATDIEIADDADLDQDFEEIDAGVLEAEFAERLDAPEFADDLKARPVAEIITEICRDLGIAAPRGTHPWKRRTPADLAVLRAKAALPALDGATALSPPVSRPCLSPLHSTPRAPPGGPAPQASGATPCGSRR